MRPDDICGIITAVFCYLEQYVKIKRVKIPAHTRVSYECETCGNGYASADRARKCESQIVEPKKFDKGNLVSWRETRECGPTSRKYFLKGIVHKVTGPTLPDEDYNFRWLRGRLTGKHVFEYHIRWICPHCKDAHEGMFYSPELIKVTEDLPFTNCKKMIEFMRTHGMYQSPQ